MGKDEPLTKEDAQEISDSNRELMRDIAIGQEKYFERIEVIMGKQTDILQQVANATTTMNHNSTLTFDLIKTLKISGNNGNSGKNESKLIDIIKYMTTAICGALIALVGSKVLGV